MLQVSQPVSAYRVQRTQALGEQIVNASNALCAVHTRMNDFIELSMPAAARRVRLTYAHTVKAYAEGKNSSLLGKPSHESRPGIKAS